MNDKRLGRMSPKARATYERIRSLRKEIGPLTFDVVMAIRELRGGSTTSELIGDSA